MLENGLNYLMTFYQVLGDVQVELNELMSEFVKKFDFSLIQSTVLRLATSISLFSIASFLFVLITLIHTLPFFGFTKDSAISRSLLFVIGNGSTRPKLSPISFLISPSSNNSDFEGTQISFFIFTIVQYVAFSLNNFISCPSIIRHSSLILKFDF